MHLVVQAAIFGILVGGVYALMASGVTLVFGIMRVINVAQGAMVILLQRTRSGRSVRAIVQNPTSAKLLGVNTDTVAGLGFGLGIATAAAAGAVYGIVYPFNPGSHYDLISRLLSIVVLGGLGSLGGALIAALFMGISESVFSAEISPTWSSFTVFIVLIGVLGMRPPGLF